MKDQIGYFNELLGRIEIFRRFLVENDSDYQVKEIRLGVKQWVELNKDPHFRGITPIATCDLLDVIKVGKYLIIFDPKIKSELICVEKEK